MVTIEMKLFDLFLVICNFSWQICQQSIVFNFAMADLGCLIIRQMRLPRNYGSTFAKACECNAMNFIGRVNENFFYKKLHFAFMAQVFMAHEMLPISKEVLSRGFIT